MTYEQLLARIDDFIHYTNNLDGGIALRAVVKLHSPNEYNKECCSICSNDNYPEVMAEYPCATLQAVVKEMQ